LLHREEISLRDNLKITFLFYVYIITRILFISEEIKKRHVYIYIYTYVCVCVCVCVLLYFFAQCTVYMEINEYANLFFGINFSN